MFLSCLFYLPFYYKHKYIVKGKKGGELMHHIITVLTIIMLPVVAVMYYAIKKNKNVSHKGRFMELKVTVNNDTNAAKEDEG